MDVDLSFATVSLVDPLPLDLQLVDDVLQVVLLLPDRPLLSLLRLDLFRELIDHFIEVQDLVDRGDTRHLEFGGLLFGSQALV